MAFGGGLADSPAPECRMRDISRGGADVLVKDVVGEQGRVSMDYRAAGICVDGGRRNDECRSGISVEEVEQTQSIERRRHRDDLAQPSRRRRLVCSVCIEDDSLATVLWRSSSPRFLLVDLGRQSSRSG